MRLNPACMFTRSCWTVVRCLGKEIPLRGAFLALETNHGPGFNAVVVLETGLNLLSRRVFFRQSTQTLRSIFEYLFVLRSSGGFARSRREYAPMMIRIPSNALGFSLAHFTCNPLGTSVSLGNAPHSSQVPTITDCNEAEFNCVGAVKEVLDVRKAYPQPTAIGWSQGYPSSYLAFDQKGLGRVGFVPYTA